MVINVQSVRIIPECIIAHLRLYGPQMAPWQLQNSFYLLLGAEIDAICSYWLKDLGTYTLPGKVTPTSTPTSPTPTPVPPADAAEVKLGAQLDKEHAKKIAQFRAEYLLDRLEVNVKSRCVFAWTDPHFRGFKPVEETQLAAVEDVLVSRRMFFPEALSVGKQFVMDYVGNRRTHYNEKREFRRNAKLGAWFLLGTCVLDIIVSTL